MLSNILRAIKCATVSLHRAARRGTLDKVPQELMTSENLYKRDKDGITVLELAITNKHLDQVPKDLIDIEYLLEDNPSKSEPLVFTAATLGQLASVPDEIFEYDTVKESGIEWFANDDVRIHDTFVHRAAYYGTLHQVPRKYLTSELLLLKSGAGNTVIKVAKDNGNLDQLIGLELTEACRKEAGEDWWVKNEVLKRQQSELTDGHSAVGVDIF